MLEHKTVFGNKYGTSKTSLLDILNNNQIPILDVDVEGMIDIRNSISRHAVLKNNQI
jgi:guanylate kinase